MEENTHQLPSQYLLFPYEYTSSSFSTYKIKWCSILLL